MSLSDLSTIKVINADEIRHFIRKNIPKIVEIIKEAYIEVHEGKAINPNSYFLTFPDNPKNRIIALPAASTDKNKISGIKWIASYPDNVKKNIQRASATIILNDYDTGYALALLEAAQISAARTAASAVLAAQLMYPRISEGIRIGFIGCGVIARTVFDFFIGQSVDPIQINIFDFELESAQSFSGYIINHLNETRVKIRNDNLSAILESDLIVFATTEVKPYLNFAKLSYSVTQKVFLGISLRDIEPESILCANNIVDDAHHCLNANTSLHLAAQKFGHTHFINGNIYDLIQGKIKLSPEKPTIFSPFGMGILDVKLAKSIYDDAVEQGYGLDCEFFGKPLRW